MKIRDHLVVFVLGGVSAMVLHLSCDGDGTPPADAAEQCDCPTAEPPLAGRLTRASSLIQTASMMSNGQSAICPIGDIVISGGCRAGSSDPRYVLNTSFATPQDNPAGWACQFYNGTTAPVTSEVYALCLKPAP